MAVAKRTIELFYDVLSPYSWVAFEVLCRYREPWNLDLKFRPFFLGGVMNSTGNQPPGMIPAKLKYMGQDLARQAEYYGIPLKAPADFMGTTLPKGSISAMRLLSAAALSQPDMTEDISRQLWLRIWSRDEDIVLPESLKMTCLAAGLNETQSTALLSRITDQDVKDKLKENTKEAIDLGAFGAPTIIAHHNGQRHMYFGSDRFFLIAHLYGVKWEGPLKPQSKI